MTDPYPAPHLVDSSEVADATDLIARYGAMAGDEAAALADRSRDIGNHVHFCRWRQIARLIVILNAPGAIGTVH